MIPVFRILLLFALSSAELEGDDYFIERTQALMDKIESDPELWQLYQEQIDRFEMGFEDEENVDDDLFPPIPEFDCDTDYESEPATTVHTLRVKDITVIASFGDSITAGNGLGAETIPGVAVENRGESWCVGGNGTVDTVFTIPNLIREYNPDIKGYSWSRYAPITERNRTHCDKDFWCAQLNLAQPGGTNRAMERQANTIIERMMDPEMNIDIENEWKMVTLFIGGNDLCRVCENWNSYSPEAYRDGIQRGLDVLHQNLPKTFVNLVVMFDITPIRNMSTSPLCDAVQWGYCVCAFNETTREMLRPVQMAYYEELADLVDSGRYDTTDDFTVVLQPHQRDIGLPYTPDGDLDHGFFSPDCFHPGRKGHHALAYMLWNVMHMPVGQKPVEYDYKDPVIMCPSEEYPYLFTKENSDVEWDQDKAITLGRKKL